MKIKICGISTVDIAQRVCALKPDAIGIYLDPEIGANSAPERMLQEIVEIASKASIDSFFLTDALDAESVSHYCRVLRNTHVQLRDDIPVQKLNY
jgi:phosphoribosylanthranilate isomerase